MALHDPTFDLLANEAGGERRARAHPYSVAPASALAAMVVAGVAGATIATAFQQRQAFGQVPTSQLTGAVQASDAAPFSYLDNKESWQGKAAKSLAKAAQADTPKQPPWNQYAERARWLVYMSDYAVAATLCSDVRDACPKVGDPFGNIMAVADGNETVSTGVIYVYLPDLDPSPKDLEANPTISLTFSAKALGDGYCKGTAEDPTCTLLTIAGTMTKLPADDAQVVTAQSFLFAKHPEMKFWPASHGWSFWYMAPENIDSFFFLDMYGPAHSFTVDEYLSANPL